MIMEKESPTTKTLRPREPVRLEKASAWWGSQQKRAAHVLCGGERPRAAPALLFLWCSGLRECRSPERSWQSWLPWEKLGWEDARHGRIVKTPKSWAPDQMFYYQSQARNQTSFDAVWRTPSRVFLCSGRKNDSIFTSCSKVRTSRAGPQKDPNRSRVGRRKKWHWLG